MIDNLDEGLRLEDFVTRGPQKAEDPSTALDFPDLQEAQKVHDLFIEGVVLVFKKNESFVHSSNPRTIITEDGFKDKTVDSDEVKPESENRKASRKKLLTREAVEEEEPFHSLPLTTSDEITAKEEAVSKEIARRTILQHGFDILYAVQTHKELPQIIEREITAEESRRNAQNPPQSFSDEDKEKIRTKLSEQYDRSGGYRLLDGDGNPTGERGQYSEAIAIIHDELKEIAKPENPDKPTPEEQKAKDLLKQLHLGPDSKLIVSSVERTNAEVIQLAALNFLEKKIRAKGFDGVLTRNEAGEITGFDDKALAELLKGQDIDGSISQITILLVAYQNNADNPNPRIRQNIISLLYGTLDHVDRASLAKVQESQVYGLRLQALTKEILTNWLEPAGFRLNTIPKWNNLFKDLCLGLFCEGKLEIEGGKNVLPKLAREVFAKMRLAGATNVDEDLIIALAQRTGTASGMLTQILGIEPDLFTDQKLLSEYAGKVIGTFQDKKPSLTTHELKAYKQVIDYNFGTDALEKIAKQNGLSGKLGMIAMLLMIFGPALQGLASDLTEEKETRQ